MRRLAGPYMYGPEPGPHAALAGRRMRLPRPRACAGSNHPLPSDRAGSEEPVGRLRMKPEQTT